MSAYFQHKGSDEDPTDLNNPQVGYDHTYMLGPLQARTGIAVAKITNSYYVSTGETAGLKLSHIMKYYVPADRLDSRSRSSAGAVLLHARLSGAQQVKNNIKSDSAKTSDIYISFIPSVEYKLTRNLNFNTSYAQGIDHYRSVHSQTTYASDPSTQRVGVGWGATRDIYINPYFAFYPTDMSIPSTWVAVNTIFSIF